MNDYKIFVVEHNKKSDKIFGKFSAIMLLFFLLVGLGFGIEHVLAWFTTLFNSLF